MIPRETREKLRMREGDFVAFARKGDGVLVKPQRLVEDDVLTAAEAKVVRRGMKQIKQGRFKVWRDVKHELGR